MSRAGSVVSDFTSLEDSDLTIDAMTVKLERMKSLLYKSKDQITYYRKLAEDMEVEKDRILADNLDLNKKLNRSHKQILPEDNDFILASAIVKSETWVCFRNSSGEIQWFSNSKVNRRDVPEPLEFTRSGIGEQVSEVVKQYEERCRRLQDALDRSEERANTLASKHKEIQKQVDALESQFKPAEKINEVIDESTSLHQQILSAVLEDETSPSYLNSLQKNVNRIAMGSDNTNIREHLVAVLKSLIDVTRRLLHSRNELQAQEQAWRATCDALIYEKDELKNSANKLRQELNRKIEEHQLALQRLKDENLKQLTSSELKCKKLQDKLDKVPNLPYLKQVVLQFLCSSDSQVQCQLINVLATLLSFTPDEMMKVHKERTPKGVLTRFFI